MEPETQPPAQPNQPPAPAVPAPAPAAPRAHRLRKRIILVLVLLGGAGAVYSLTPIVITMLNTVSTDDAYVNSHVTFVAPRVAGEVVEVLVDDNYRVKKDDVLVRIDPEPYEIQVDIKQAAVETAQRDLEAANAQVRGQVALIRSNKYKLDHAIENVNTQVANLHSAVATLNLAKSNLKRGEDLAPTGGISKEELDQRRQTVKVDEAAVYAIRAGLGLPDKPEKGDNLAEVPADLAQNYSVVRQALSDLLQSAAQIGYLPTKWDSTPQQAIADFLKQNPEGSLDAIYAKLIPEAPAIKQAEAKLLQAKADLEQANLNLRYCTVVSDIDGVVTRRNVHQGDYIQVGQNLMAVRPLRPPDVWIDANFKETQLADLRIGQRVRLEADMYGSRRQFEGRISGFTMGTGETLALLPPQNATGNFVKIVQRLPVRIELVNYDPDKYPLFVGLSVEPYVYYKEPPTGPNAGKFLQPYAPLPQAPAQPRPRPETKKVKQ